MFIGGSRYHDAELVCLEDGSEMKSLLMIREHQSRGHKEFLLVGPNAIVPEYRAMNADRAFVAGPKLVARIWR